MSGVGRAPIPVPAGVEVTLGEGSVAIKGPKGELARPIPAPISLRRDGDELVVERPDDERRHRALHGLTRSLINNMVIGVTEGYRKNLVGYRANAKGSTSLELALGFSHPVVVDAPEGITFEVPTPTQIGVIGIDKELVGQVAANIRAIRKPEPYKGKGVRYEGERVLRKAGKAGK